VDAIGNPGEFAVASIQVGELPTNETASPAAGITDTPTPAPAQGITDTPTPTPAQAITDTSTPFTLAGLTIQSDSNANCRSGPGVAYPIEDVLQKGQSGMIEGRNADSSWVWILKPSSSSGSHCWVAVEVGVVQGDLSKVSIVSAPPPPIVVVTTEAPPPIIIIVTIVAPPPAPPEVMIAVSDSTLLNESNPCSNFPKTTSVRAVVTTSASLTQVILKWNQNGETGSTPMAFSGGETYTSSLGPFANPGFVTVWVEAVDNTGQTGASVSASVEVSSACIQ
jgi:hypothetical protein